MIHDSIAEVVGGTPVVRLSRLFATSPIDVLAKLEYLNPLGSSKDRVARHVIERSIERGLLEPGGELLESSSGNFGIALAALGPLYGLRVTCVVDPTIRAANLTILRSLGAEVVMVREPDANGGYLGTRLRRVRELTVERPKALWTNQYANELCWGAHAENTAVELLSQVDVRIDVLAIAVSTTATLLGTARGIRRRWPEVRLVAVDAEGSVAFGGRAGARRLPGLGSSRHSELMERSDVDEVVHVAEADAIRGCRDLLRTEGILAGASSGAVVSALRPLSNRLAPGTTVATLLPDRGERYLDLIHPDR